MPFCSALENHCCVDVRLNYRPCCHFDQLDNSRFPISLYSFKDYKNSNFFLKIKKEMEEGWSDGCQKCQKAEERGITSLRQTYNEKFSGTENQLEFIDIALSNTCNLTCKMCNDTYSSRWQSILQKSNSTKIFNINQPLKIQEKFKVSEIFKNLNLTHLKEIKYLGGEPFITREFKELLDFIKKENLIDKISFRCNTNCTFFPQKILNDLIKFKSIRIDFSIDGVDDLCNFVRTGKDWGTILSVVEKWLDFKTREKEKILINLHHTSNAYNLHQFDLIKKFAESKSINFNYYILGEPDFLSYQVLPRKYIYHLIESRKVTEIAVLRTLLNQGPQNKMLWKKFIQYTRKTDSIMGTDISKTIPKLSSYFTEII